MHDPSPAAGHLLAPLDATFQGAAVGIWLKNARAAARKAQENEQRRTEGLPVESSAGALSDERREQLEDIDASWCPSWPVTWQRCFHLVRLHLDAGGTLPTTAGDVVRQGEDLGRWVQAQRVGWDKLTGVQQWMLVHILGIKPASEDEKAKPRTSQAQKWALHLTAATQFYEREGHLQVPRKHVETVTISSPSDSDGEGQEQRDTRLGAWVSNQRSRAARLTPQRVEQLSAIGMRWTEDLRHTHWARTLPCGPIYFRRKFLGSDVTLARSKVHTAEQIQQADCFIAPARTHETTSRCPPLVRPFYVDRHALPRRSSTASIGDTVAAAQGVRGAGLGWFKGRTVSMALTVVTEEGLLGRPRRLAASPVQPTGGAEDSGGVGN